MTWNRTTGATSRALRTDPVIVDGIARHSVRIPAKPITHSELMAIAIPKDADHRRSEATLGRSSFDPDQLRPTRPPSVDSPSPPHKGSKPLPGGFRGWSQPGPRWQSAVAVPAFPITWPSAVPGRFEIGRAHV